MKNYFFLCTLTVLLNVSLNAQINVNVSSPAWGPVVTTQEYYYLPDIDSYYDIRQTQFIYRNNGNWIRSKALPKRYKSYNLNRGHIVVLNDYHGRSPFAHFKHHKTKYFKKGSHWKGNGEGEMHHGKGKDNRNKKKK